MHGIMIDSLRSEDAEAVRTLLAQAGLCVSDLTPAILRDFRVAHRGNTVVGAAGIERYADVALLRSVVVDPALRGMSVGRRLVEEVEANARTQGVKRLFLLTKDAERFFSKMGYASLSRKEVPGAITATAQFASLCPASYPLMAKWIGE